MPGGWKQRPSTQSQGRWNGIQNSSGQGGQFLTQVIVLRASPISMVQSIRATAPTAGITLLSPFGFVAFSVKSTYQVMPKHGLVVAGQLVKRLASGARICKPKATKVRSVANLLVYKPSPGPLQAEFNFSIIAGVKMEMPKLIRHGTINSH